VVAAAVVPQSVFLAFHPSTCTCACVSSMPCGEVDGSTAAYLCYRCDCLQVYHR
jgi:hypothetical protein